MKRKLFIICILIFALSFTACKSEEVTDKTQPTPTQTTENTQQDNTPKEWSLKYHETFDKDIASPKDWTEDTYGKDSPYYVDAFSDDGDFFKSTQGATFTEQLDSFRAFRKAFTYGEDDWITFEYYGKDEDKDGKPESGGEFIAEKGKAKLISKKHTDGAILRSTDKLPEEYRVEVTVSNIDFGGTNKNGKWEYDGKVNGYDGGDESAGPWTQDSAVSENGVYFLCITDYENPAPHNNVFIHHHRKVVMDTDNNNYGGSSWSKVWDPDRKGAIEDGSRYVNLLWLNGTSFGDNNTGNKFVSYVPDKDTPWQHDSTFADKYLPNEEYVFTIERDKTSYTLSISGKFYYGGETTYTAKREFTEDPLTWHYNQTPEDYPKDFESEKILIGDEVIDTWEKDASYPDFFFFGDPHINYYEGTCDYDDLKLYVKE